MLTATEAALLGLLRKGPSSGYDLRKDVERSVGYFWAPAKTQIYATLPRLVAAGLATQEKVVQDARPDKTIYSLTDAGRTALRDWIADAQLSGPQGRNLLLLKVYFGEGADLDALRHQVVARREEAERLLAELRELDRAGEGGSPFEALTRRFGLLYAEALLRWTAEAERELQELALRSTSRPA